MTTLLDVRTSLDNPLETVREYRPCMDFSRRLALEGIQTFSVFQLPCGIRKAEEFRSLVLSARESHGALGACLHVYEAAEYDMMRLFIDPDGYAGFALDGQEVVSVFCHKARRKRYASRTLMPLAASLGGVFLNAFDTFLPRIYARSGFKPVARLAWDSAQAPADWDYEATSSFNGGKPDVVFMTYLARERAVRRVETYEAGELWQKLAVNSSFVEVKL